MPELELHAFINSVADLIGAEHTRFLTDLWLDELASMDTMPEPTSPDWRLVTLAASARLAGRLIRLTDDQPSVINCAEWRSGEARP